MTRIVRHFLLALVLAVIAPTAGAAQLPRDFGTIMREMQPAAGPMPEADEIVLGRELAGRLLGATPLVNDARVQLYVNRIGKRIARQSDRPDLTWRFGVVESVSLNVYSAPGGYVFITRALYEALEEEAQLAGALAHAVAAIARHHHTVIARKIAATAAMARIAQAMIAQRSGIHAGLLDTGSEIQSSNINRMSIHEADEAAVVLAARAGYAPHGLVDVIHKLQVRRPETPEAEALYATHPSHAERLARLGEILAPMIGSAPPGISLPLERSAPLR